MAGRFGRQVNALIHKNFVIRKHKPCRTACEFLFAFIIVGLGALQVFLFKTLGEPNPEYPNKTLSYGTLASTYYFHKCFNKTCAVAFVPDSENMRNFSSALMKQVFGGDDVLDKWFLKDEEELNQAWENNDTAEFIFALIMSDESENNRNYTIVMNNTDLPHEKIPVPSGPLTISTKDYHTATLFLEHGFSAIQMGIDAILNGLNLSYAGQEMPYYSVSLWKLLAEACGTVMSSYILFASIPFLGINTADLTEEKKSRMQQYLLMLGLKKSAYWTSWMLTFIITSLIPIISSSLFPALAGAITGFGIVRFVCFLILFYISLSAFCFFIASVSKTVTVSTILSVLIAFFLPQVFSAVPRIEYAHKLICLLSPYSLIFAIYKSVVGSLLPDNPAFSDMISWGFLFGIVIFDTLLYLLLTWYISEVLPGQFGVGKPWYFPFTKQYWVSLFAEHKPKKAIQGNEDPNDEELSSDDGDEDPSVNKENFEKRDFPNGKGLSIRKLRKVFSVQGGDNVYAVDGVSADFAKGEITALLGHNGAGKTTTINMLTGLFPPTSGNAFVDSDSIVNNMDQIRDSMGICPQDDIVYGDLTAPEHLLLVGMLKGMQGTHQSILDAAEKMLANVYLDSTAHRNACVSTFSGGMRRKLSLAMALFGEPRVVFLDEPTTGIDSLSRRCIWDALRNLKGDKTIILTTHSMEEADALCDSIFIMSHGKLKCSGTSLFLKQHFGVGYIFNFEKKTRDSNGIPSSASAGSTTSAVSDCDAAAVVGAIQQIVPEAQLQNEETNSFKVTVPAADDVDKITQILDMLETKKEEFLLDDFGVSLTSLEDVFIQVSGGLDTFGKDPKEAGTANEDEDVDAVVGDEEEKKKGGDEHEHDANERLLPGNDGDRDYGSSSSSSSDGGKVPPIAGVGRQIKAMAWYNFEYFKRDPLSTVLLCIGPCVIMFILYLFLELTSMSSGSTIEKGDSTHEHILNSMLYTKDFYNISYIVGDRTTEANVMKIFEAINSTSDKLSTFAFQRYYDPETLRKDTYNYGNLTAGVMFHDISFENKALNVTLLYNNTKVHSLPMIQNLITVGFNKCVGAAATSKISTYSYSFYYFNKSNDEQSDLSMSDTSSVGSTIIIALIVGVIISTSVLVKRFVYERTSMFKSQLFISGMRPVIYVIVNNMFLFCVIFVSTLLGLILLIILDSSKVACGVPFILGILFVFSSTTFSTFFSNIFSQPESAIKWNLLFQVMFAVGPYLVYAIFSLLALVFKSYGWVTTVFNITLYISPFTAFLSGIVSCGSLTGNGQTPTFKSLFKDDSIFHGSIGMSVACVVYLILSIILETVHAYNFEPEQTQNSDVFEEDADVAAERQAINSGVKTPQNTAVYLKNAQKTYVTRKGRTRTQVRAVRNISLTVSPNECFGILGPNGAGKSTTIGMLTGEVRPTCGDVYLNHVRVKGHKGEVFAKIGLGRCMQHDTLLDFCTPYEHIKIMCMCRSDAPDSVLEDTTRKCLKRVGLVEYRDRQVCALSGGNRRRLSVVLAMLPHARLLLFDEPTTGMDPVARRAMWHSIQKQRALPGHTVVLTTHTMEEAEAVCSSLAIVSRGTLACLGSVQHLRKRFSQGYRVSFAYPSSAAANQAMQTQAPQKLLAAILKLPESNIILSEIGETGFTYTIPRPEKLGRLFSNLSANLAAVGAKSFAVSQASLDDVFVSLVRKDEQETV